jgi:hypothetical protein
VTAIFNDVQSREQSEISFLSLPHEKTLASEYDVFLRLLKNDQPKPRSGMTFRRPTLCLCAMWLIHHPVDTQNLLIKSSGNARCDTPKVNILIAGGEPFSQIGQQGWRKKKPLH